MDENYEQLKLENQICFPLYAVSRLVIQQYKDLLHELDVTYPQYLVLLVLWEKDDIHVRDISNQLFLESNTLTPLLKRMEANELLVRSRSKRDERVVNITLTKKGRELQSLAANIPNNLINKLDCYTIEEEDLMSLKRILDSMLSGAKN